jgi:hypothetical protein
MKTAILFSGQLRSFDSIYFNIKTNLINSFGECDIFFCVGDSNLDLVYKHIIPTKEIYDYDNSYEENFSISLALSDQYIPSFLSQWRGVYLVKELMLQHSTKYDYVIRTRPDIAFSKPIIPPKISPGVITVSKYGSFTNGNLIGMNDKFAIGSFDDMIIYCDFYQSEIIRSYHGNSEQKLYKYLTEKGISLNTLDNALIKTYTDGRSRVDFLC